MCLSLKEVRQVFFKFVTMAVTLVCCISALVKFSCFFSFSFPTQIQFGFFCDLVSGPNAIQSGTPCPGPKCKISLECKWSWTDIWFGPKPRGALDLKAKPLALFNVIFLQWSSNIDKRCCVGFNLFWFGSPHKSVCFNSIITENLIKSDITVVGP